jgi:hypothetical protein
MEMNRSMVVNVFDEELYQEYILSLAKDISKKRSIFRKILDTFR